MALIAPEVTIMGWETFKNPNLKKFPLFPKHQELAIVLYLKEFRFFKGKKLIVLKIVVPFYNTI